MAAVRIIGKSQRVVDAPGLTIDELAGQFFFLHILGIIKPIPLEFSGNIATKDDLISMARNRQIRLCFLNNRQ